MDESKKNNLVHRTITGGLLGAIVLITLYLGGAWWHLVGTVIAILSLWEYYSLLRQVRPFPMIVGLICGLYILLTAHWRQWGMNVSVLVIATFLVFVIEMWKRERCGTSDGAENAGLVVSGLTYIIIPWTLMIYLRTTPFGHLATLTLFLCTWSCDVFAYLVGMLWGKHRPFCSVSPKKSLEGFAGGFVASLLCSVLISAILKAQPLPFLIIGLICGSIGQLGDLTESLVKREMGAKDSGVLLPGHGGFLDRFDSILASGSLVALIWGYLV